MWRRLVLREAVHLFLILAAVSLLHHTVGAFEVEGASMEPTLHSRQYVVVDTLLPRARSVQRGGGDRLPLPPQSGRGVRQARRRAPR